MTNINTSDLDLGKIKKAHHFQFHTCGDSDHIHLVAFDETGLPLVDMTISIDLMEGIISTMRTVADIAKLDGRPGGHSDVN